MLDPSMVRFALPSTNTPIKSNLPPSYIYPPSSRTTASSITSVGSDTRVSKQVDITLSNQINHPAGSATHRPHRPIPTPIDTSIANCEQAMPVQITPVQQHMLSVQSTQPTHAQPVTVAVPPPPPPAQAQPVTATA